MADVPEPDDDPGANAISRQIADALRAGTLPPAEQPVLPQQPQQAQLIVVGTVYHQPPGCEPVAVVERWGRALATTGQPLVGRKVTIGPDWQPIGPELLALVPRASLVVVENREGTALATNPTEAQRAEIAAKVVEVGVVPAETGVSLGVRTMHSPPKVPTTPVPFDLAGPGESARVSPPDAAALRLRCRSGSAACVLSLFPE